MPLLQKCLLDFCQFSKTTMDDLCLQLSWKILSDVAFSSPWVIEQGHFLSDFKIQWTEYRLWIFF